MFIHFELISLIDIYETLWSNKHEVNGWLRLMSLNADRQISTEYCSRCCCQSIHEVPVWVPGHIIRLFTMRNGMEWINYYMFAVPGQEMFSRVCQSNNMQWVSPADLAWMQLPPTSSSNKWFYNPFLQQSTNQLASCSYITSSTQSIQLTTNHHILSLNLAQPWLTSTYSYSVFMSSQLFIKKL